MCIDIRGQGQVSLLLSDLNLLRQGLVLTGLTSSKDLPVVYTLLSSFSSTGATGLCQDAWFFSI